MKRLGIVAVLAALLAGCGGRQPASGEEKNEARNKRGPVEISIEAQKHVGLKVSQAAMAQLAEYLEVTGTVQPVDSRVAVVRPPSRGRMVEIMVRVGDRVRHGQSLARLDNLEAVELLSQLRSALAEVQRLKVQAAAQTRQTERLRRLAEIGAAARKDFEQSEAEQQAHGESVKSQDALVTGLVERLRRLGVTDPSGPASSLTDLRAPFDGIVVKADAAPGVVVDLDTALFSITDISRVWVQAEVYEKDLGKVRVGQTAYVTVDTYPGQQFAGKVTYVSDMLDPGTRTAKVRCEVPNQDMRLKLDMFASVRLPTDFTIRTVAVPEGSVQKMDGKDVVFVRLAPTQFEARPVRVGRTVSGLVEIAAGLREGEPIVTHGTFHLKSILASEALGEEE